MSSETVNEEDWRCLACGMPDCQTMRHCAAATRMRNALDALVDHVRAAAPLSWSGGDERAYEWEKQLAPILQTCDAVLAEKRR